MAKMFDKGAKDFDAVVVSTPDRMHAPVSMAAMQLDWDGEKLEFRKAAANQYLHREYRESFEL